MQIIPQDACGLPAPGKTPPKQNTIAFVFDIDGVFVRGVEPVPGGAQSLSSLQAKRIPFLFLTNGGGKSEKAHVDLLSSRLGLSFCEDQFVQSHTPFRDLVPEFGDKTILVLGGGANHTVRDVAHEYGFKKVMTSSDLVKEEGGHVYPFMELTQDHHDELGRKHKAHAVDREDGTIKISAIMVLSSPRDVGLDLSLVLDLLQSDGGLVGTLSAKNGDPTLPNNGYLQDGQPKVYFCNPDLTWATSYHNPRVAQGMFKAYLEGGWTAITKGADLSSHIEVYGKPTEKTYTYAEKTLLDYNVKLHGPDAPPIKAIYMVGDNPESDVRGANSFQSTTGITWKSVLVCTGVHDEGSVPAYVPTVIVKDAKEAVEWAILDASLDQ